MSKAADDSQKRHRAPRSEFVDRPRKNIEKWDKGLYEELKSKSQTTSLAGQDLADFERMKDLKPKSYKGGCCCDPALLWFDNALITSIIK